MFARFLELKEKWHQHEIKYHDKKIWRPILILVAVGFVVYFNSLFNGFVWEDNGQITNNFHSLSLQSIPLYFITPHNKLFYRPMFLVVLTLYYFFFHGQVFYYHLASVMIHIISGLLVYYIFQKFFKSPWALLLSLLFIVHPFATETVADASSIADVYTGVLGLASIALVMSEEPRWINIAVSIFLLLTAIFFKELGYFLILIFCLYRFLFHQQRNKIILASAAGVAVFYSVLRFLLIHSTLHAYDMPIVHTTLAMRLATLPKILEYYLFNTFLPIGLAINQVWIVPKINLEDFILPLVFDFIVIGAIAYLGKFLYKKKNLMFIPYLFFLAIFSGLLMYSQIFPIEFTVADRWTYVPMIGLIGLVGIAMQEILSIYIKDRRILIGIVVGVIVVYGLLTIRRNSDWYNNVTLYSHDIAVLQHTNYPLEYGLAIEYIQKNDFDNAKTSLKNVLKLKSDDCRVWFLLGEVTVNKSVDEAKNYYKKALELGSPCGYTLEKYALISSQTDKPLEAQFFILNAIKKYPEKPLLKATLAITEYRIGDKTQARKTIAEVYATSKDSTIEQIYKRIMK